MGTNFALTKVRSVSVQKITMETPVMGTNFDLTKVRSVNVQKITIRTMSRGRVGPSGFLVKATCRGNEQ